MDKEEQRLIQFIGIELLTLLLKIRRTARSKGVELDELLDKAEQNNKISFDDL